MSERIHHFKDLRVYREACELDFAVFSESKKFPVDEAYALIEPIRRSSRSIGAAIAAAWAQRRYRDSFLGKLSDADSELQSTRHWLDRAVACQYLSESACRSLEERCDHIGAMLGKLIFSQSEPPANGPRSDARSEARPDPPPNQRDFDDAPRPDPPRPPAPRPPRPDPRARGR